VRITHINVDRWRNLHDLRLEVPAESSLICLVGSNGTGKTNILELLSFAAASLGLAAGVRPAQRPAPPPESRFHAKLHVGEELEVPEDLLAAHIGQPSIEELGMWDRTLTLWHFSYVPPPEQTPPGAPPGTTTWVLAGGIAVVFAHRFASAVVQALHQRLELNHLFLDAERSYGPVSIRDEEILAAAREDPDAPGRARQLAIAATQGMYQEWLRSAVGLEHRHATAFAQSHREATVRGEPGPVWNDPWAEYRSAVRGILPHLEFDRPDQARRTLIFRVGGAEVPYHELSGGEREVAFLTGQILRFGLKRGVLLLDEPELHLNAELLERWLRWASETVTNGQVWIATHSLEAVEVAGTDNALVLERGPDGAVRQMNPLSQRPVMSTLSGALGAPAFSLDRQRFILIEGERPGAERRRFARLCPGSDNLFLEAGSCKQVIHKLTLVREVANETDRLHIGGVVDRDHWDTRQVQRYTTQAPVHVLGVHEIENLLLFPDALVALVARNNDAPERAGELLREACDRFAGIWVCQRAALRHDIDLGPTLRAHAAQLAWSGIDSDRDAVARRLAASADLADESIRPRVEAWLTHAIEQYADVRAGDALWAQCSGKQVVKALAKPLGLASGDALERQVLRMLERGEIEAPPALVELRSYVNGLSAAMT